MIKIDLEKFDMMLQNELTNDEKYIEVKNILTICGQDDVEKMTTFLFKFSEKIFNKGFVEGIKFIANKEKVNLFNID